MKTHEPAADELEQRLIGGTEVDHDDDAYWASLLATEPENDSED